MINYNNLKRELERLNLGQYFDYFVQELKKGRNLKEIYYEVTKPNFDTFVKNVLNPEKHYLAQSYLVDGKTEVIINSEKPVEGEIKVTGNADVTPNCHKGQTPHQENNKLFCKIEPDSDVNYE